MLKLTLVVAVASCVLFCVDTGKGVAAQNWEDTYTFYSRDGSSSYSDPPEQTYGHVQMPTYHMNNYDMPEEMEEGKTKEEKKCAVKLVLPPLIIIAVFLGLILLHLVIPTLFPAILNPFFIPIIAVINALTGATNGIILPRGDGRSDDAFAPLMHLTSAVTAAVTDDECFARLLCEAGRELPGNGIWSSALSSIVPEEYSEYISVVREAKPSTKCSALYKCSALKKL